MSELAPSYAEVQAMRAEIERLRAALKDLLEFSPRDRVLAVCRAALANGNNK